MCIMMCIISAHNHSYSAILLVGFHRVVLDLERIWSLLLLPEPGFAYEAATSTHLADPGQINNQKLIILNERGTLQP